MLLAAAAVLAASGSPASACDGSLCGAQALVPFFRELETRGSFRGLHPVHILQIGDSHSAGDSITGPWRESLQARYGGGGRGVMPPGVPFAGFLPHGVSAHQAGRWKIEATFGKGLRPTDDHAIFGASGFRLTSQEDGASFSLTANPEEAFDRAVVCAEDVPGGGQFTLQAGPDATTVSTNAPAPRVSCTTFASASAQTSVSVTTQGGPVTITSWATFRDDSGVAVSNLGVVGAQLRHFAEADDQALTAELSAYAPDLIVLAFGTNEGFSPKFDAFAFETTLRAQLERLKRLSGGVPILMLGAPDADSNRAELARNADPAGPPAPPAERDGRGSWFPPPALAQVREIQRRVAAQAGVAFWNWGARMGGPGAADSWASMDPPRIRKDRVHYTSLGGAEIAARLQADLDQAAAGLAGGD